MRLQCKHPGCTNPCIPGLDYCQSPACPGGLVDPAYTPAVCDTPGCTHNAVGVSSRGTLCSECLRKSTKTKAMDAFIEQAKHYRSLQDGMDPLTWLNPLDNAIQEANAPSEPGATCEDHPGEYGTNCVACDNDRAAWKRWKQAKGGES